MLISVLIAIPIPDPTKKRNRIILKGDIPSPSNPPTGCRFHTRCPYVMEVCKEEIQIFLESAPDHFVACHLVNKK